jgi:ribosome-interacting GTPase 1
MAKIKYNKEERKAIINKVISKAREAEKASYEFYKSTYKPSETYKKAKKELEKYNKICLELRKLLKIQNGWKFTEIDIDDELNRIKKSEIDELTIKYWVSESELETDIILSNMNCSVDELIEKLLQNCLIKNK